MKFTIYDNPKRLRRKKRTRDPDYLKKVRELPCLACGFPVSEAHHVKSRGAGGGDDWWNVISLCSDHHTLGNKAWHRIGAKSFLKEFPHVWDLLRQYGWKMIGDRPYHE